MLKMVFRLQGKYWFLTYSQCTLNKDDVLAQILAKTGASKCLVSHELHSSGESHLHAALELSVRLNTTSERYFDIEGFHPNIQKAKSWIKICRYVKKDGDIAFWPEDLSFEEFETEDSKEFDPSQFANKTDWLLYCIQECLPYGYANELWRLSHVSRGNLITESTTFGTICPQLENTPLLPGSTVVVGDTGLGKSSWAKKHLPKPSLLVTHMDDLRLFDPTFHKGILFDDMDFTHLPVTSQIHIVDQDDGRSLHARYGCSFIPPHTMKVFTCNKDPFVYHAAITRRIKQISVYSSDQLGYPGYR